MPTHPVRAAKAANSSANAQRSTSQKHAWARARSQIYDLSGHVEDVHFGIELECFVPKAAFQRLGLVRGAYHSGAACPASIDTLGLGWKCERDASIDAACPSGKIACEFVSPPLTGAAGFNEIYAFVKALKDSGATVNSACGLHVSVSLQDIAGTDTPQDVRLRNFLRRLLRFVSIHENGMLHIGGLRSRVANKYCNSIKRWQDFHALKKNCTRESFWNTLNYYGRYQTLNLQCIRGPQPRIEFRVFAGTVNPIKALGYIAVALGIVHKAANAPLAPKQVTDASSLSAVIDDRKAVARLHKALWQRPAGPKLGVAPGVWAKWSSRILKNQRQNAASFQQEPSRQAGAATGGSSATADVVEVFDVENAPSAAEQTAYERWIRRHVWNRPGNYVRFAIFQVHRSAPYFQIRGIGSEWVRLRQCRDPRAAG